MKRWVVISSTVVAIAIAVALLLRPSRSIDPELPLPAHIPPDVRVALKGTMQRHGADMRELIMRLVVLDNDGAARIAGSVYDESTVDQTPEDAHLQRFLPPRFFALKGQLKAEARQIVAAAARRDSGALVEHFGALTRTCILCHQTYLFDRPAADPAASGPVPAR